MNIIIQKLPNIEGDVALIDTDGNQHPVYDYYQKFELPDPQGNPMELIFRNYNQMFIPDGPKNQFMDGGQYTLMELNGDYLLISNDNIVGNKPNPKWIPLY